MDDNLEQHENVSFSNREIFVGIFIVSKSIHPMKHPSLILVIVFVICILFSVSIP